MAKTSPMVSLNWRTLLNPAANAMSETFMAGGDQQGAGGLGAAGPRQGQRTGAEFVAEDPVELARGVAQPGGEPLDAVAVDDAVVDEPHGPAGDVGAQFQAGVPGTASGRQRLQAR